MKGFSIDGKGSPTPKTQSPSFSEAGLCIPSDEGEDGSGDGGEDGDDADSHGDASNIC